MLVPIRNESASVKARRPLAIFGGSNPEVLSKSQEVKMKTLLCKICDDEEMAEHVDWDITAVAVLVEVDGPMPICSHCKELCEEQGEDTYPIPERLLKD